MSTVQTTDLTTLEFYALEEHHGKELLVCDDNNVEMDRQLVNSIDNLNRYVSQLGLVVKHFKVVKRVCIFSRQVNLQDLASQVSAKSTVFVHFQRRNKPNFNIRSACGNDVKIIKCCQTLSWPVSDKVVQTAQSTSLQLGLHKPYTAVHVRIERIILKYIRYNITSGLECITKIKQLLKMLQQQQKLDINQTILVHDIGEFGTGGVPIHEGTAGVGEFYYRAGMKVLTELRKIGLKEFHYKPGKGDIQNRGFVALVEKEILARADLLVMMGGGHFEQSLIGQFIPTHDKSNLYTVCLAKIHFLPPPEGKMFNHTARDLEILYNH